MDHELEIVPWVTETTRSILNNKYWWTTAAWSLHSQIHLQYLELGLGGVERIF